MDEEDGADDELESEEEDELVFDESASATSAPSLGRLAIRAASPPMPGASWSCPSCASSSASVKTKSGGGGKLFLSCSKKTEGNGSNDLGCNTAWSRLRENKGAWTHHVFTLSAACSRVSPSTRFIRFVQSVTADILWYGQNPCNAPNLTLVLGGTHVKRNGDHNSVLSCDLRLVLAAGAAAVVEDVAAMPRAALSLVVPPAVASSMEPVAALISAAGGKATTAKALSSITSSALSLKCGSSH